MNIGQRVLSDLYEDYGTGTILSQSTLFSKTSYKVFFESIGKTVELYEDDLQNVDTPIDLFKSCQFSTISEFKLNFLAYTIEATLSGEKPISAAGYKIMPLPHQILALDHVINQFRPRYLLADEVGLGKTIEAALIMEELKLRNIVKRVLIITPAGLTKQWQEELKLKFDEDFSVFNSSTFRTFKELNGKDYNVWNNFSQVITSIDFLKPKKISSDLKEDELARRNWHNKEVFDDCLNAQWDMVIIDEAHKLSKYYGGEETARYKLGKELSDRVPIFILATATPHRGKSDVFLNLLRLVDPYIFTNSDSIFPENVKKVTIRNKKRATVDLNGNLLFKERITTVCRIERDSIEDGPEIELYDAVSEYVSEYYNYAKEENNYLMVFLLMLYQRIVSSSSRAILKSLNRRLEFLTSTSKSSKNIIDSSMEDYSEIPSEDWIKSFDNNSPLLKNPEKVRKEIIMVSNCIKLAKKSIIGRNDAKLRTLIRIIDDIKRNENKKDVKILIFTEFVETQNYLVESLERLGYKTAIINGGMDLNEKIRQKMKFRTESQILVSTDAGGEGINLQFCHVVINYDLPWNPMQIEQRIGRVDRIGQEHDVFVSNFVIADSIEEYVREKLESKLNLVKEQFGEDKYSDILSTLNEDFNFDDLFMNFISNRDNNIEIEEISNQIFNKAVEILENDEMLVPFSDLNVGDTLEIEEIKMISSRVHALTETFFEGRSGFLKEYKDKNGFYHIENDFMIDQFPRQYTNVIFDQNLGMEIEDSTLFSFNHPFINQAILHSKKNGKAAVMNIQQSKFSGNSGYLFVWYLTISNNFDLKNNYLLPIFISDDGKYNRRISEYLRNLDKFEISSITNQELPDVQNYYSLAESIINNISENIFIDRENLWNSKVENEYQKMTQYYNQRIDAINQIKIDNIREGRLKELRKEQHTRDVDMKKRRQLFPELFCTQIARIVFK